jgi:uncharacterized membrane protein
MAKSSGIKNLRRYFIAGIVSLFPLGITLFVIYFGVSSLGPIFGSLLHFLPALARLPRQVLTILGFVILLVVILLIGMVAAGTPGSWVLKRLADFFNRLPLLRSIYGTARQLTDAVLVDRQSLKQVVLVEYPRPQCWSLGFLMSDAPIFIHGREYRSIFVPSTPTPTSGFPHLIPLDMIIKTSIGVDEGLKFVISGGVVLPDELRHMPVTVPESPAPAGQDRAPASHP